jgi:hypothetical protein
VARVFAYLMQADVSLTDAAIFEDVSQTIENAMEEIYKNNVDFTSISTTALSISLKKLIL